LKGFVVQTNADGATGAAQRYYLLATSEADACASAATLLGTDIERVGILREMANWEVEVFCPFPNELRPAP
jgi:hypothetical protein